MSCKRISMLCQCAFAMVAAAATATSAQAQGNIRSVFFYTVKPDRVADFQAAIKEYNAIEAKGGSTRYYTMWVSLTGPHQYLLVVNVGKWAELDAGTEPK